MEKHTIFLCVFGLLISCNQREAGSNLFGKWEAEYLVRTNQDTTFYQAGTPSPCAYIILPFDYNSGFEIKDATNGELIWCGTNKGQFFTWSYENHLMTVKFNEVTASVTIDNLTDSSMQITVSSGDKYQMKKY